MHFTAAVALHRRIGGERLDTDARTTTQEECERIASHLGNNMSRQADDGFAHQVLQMTARILHFVEGAFHTCAHAVEPAVKGMGVLGVRVGLSYGANTSRSEHGMGLNISYYPVWLEHVPERGTSVRPSGGLCTNV